MSGFQQDPGELTQDEMYERPEEANPQSLADVFPSIERVREWRRVQDVRKLDASLVEENDGDESGPAHDELEPRSELRTRFRQSIEIIKQARRITELERQVAKLYDYMNWDL